MYSGPSFTSPMHQYGQSFGDGETFEVAEPLHPSEVIGPEGLGEQVPFTVTSNTEEQEANWAGQGFGCDCECHNEWFFNRCPNGCGCKEPAE